MADNTVNDKYKEVFEFLKPLVIAALDEMLSSGNLTEPQKSQVIANSLSGLVTASITAVHSQAADARAATLNDAQVQKINTEKTTLTTQSANDTAVKNAQRDLLVRQKSALDDALRRDIAKIVTESLGIIKSGGNNAGGWWDAASMAVNNLAGFNIANVATDPL